MIKIAIAALAVIALADIAVAQSPAPVRAACTADVQRLCNGLRGQGLSSCMRVNADRLSAECRQALRAARLKAKEFKPE